MLTGRTRWITLALIATMILLPALVSAKTKTYRTVLYTGTLKNENLAPLGGVYPLTFSLYKTRKSRRSVWSETLWVAVENGSYSVEIGARKKISRKLNLDKMFIAVSVVDLGEILRERLVPEVTPPTQATPPPASATVSTAASAAGAPVDLAMYAYEAEYAKNTARLNNMDVEELKKYIHVPVKIGTKTKNTGAAGGTGGYEFTESCPKGHVVTGIRGASGKYIDSITLICSPLE